MSTYTTTYGDTYTITNRIGTYYGEECDYTIIEAHTKDGTLASELYADTTTGQIMNVSTEEAFQGEGIASALIDYAIDNDITLYHSPIEHCTPAGLAFAEKNDQIDIIPAHLAYAA